MRREGGGSEEGVTREGGRSEEGEEGGGGEVRKNVKAGRQCRGDSCRGRRWCG